MSRIQSTIMSLILVFFAVVFAVGCNTMEGMGQDIERGGEEIQDAAD